MRIAITGASGYIGNILVKNLLDNEFEVTAIDNFRYDNRQIFQLASYPKLNIIEGDVRDNIILKKIFNSKIKIGITIKNIFLN